MITAMAVGEYLQLSYGVVSESHINGVPFSKDSRFLGLGLAVTMTFLATKTTVLV